MKAKYNGGNVDGQYTIGKIYDVEETIGNGITLFDDDDLEEKPIEWLRKNREPWFECKSSFTIV